MAPSRIRMRMIIRMVPSVIEIPLENSFSTYRECTKPAVGSRGLCNFQERMPETAFSFKSLERSPRLGGETWRLRFAGLSLLGGFGEGNRRAGGNRRLGLRHCTV